MLLRGAVQKKNSIFTDIVQIGGIFDKSLRGRGSQNLLSKIEALFCMIYFSIWPNQGTLCLSVCTHDPQKVIRIIENVNAKPKMS